MKSNDTLYIAWQSEKTRSWHVVGQLKKEKNFFIFKYTKGAKFAHNFQKFSGMPNFNEAYKSDTLFPLFKNRIMSNKRPEYPTFLNWLGLKQGEESELEILSRSGGTRKTDRIQTFKKLEIQESGQFIYYFFLHGLRHLNIETQKKVDNLEVGTRLFLAQDIQNKSDPKALIIRTENPTEIIGYCPKYITNDLSARLNKDPESVEVTVSALQSEAPTHYKLMCKIEGHKIREPLTTNYNDDEYQTFI